MGRHREFDVDQALDAVLCVFWRKGYDGASYTDLTQATGVERPALYSAFGNKEALFRLALSRYEQRFLGFYPIALQQPTSREVVEHVLRGTVELNTRFPDHTGCLGLNGGLAGSDESEPVRQILVDARASSETALRERFERARREGDLPGTADCTALAAFVTTVMNGIAVQAKAGVGREVLEAVAAHALSTWPTGDSGPADPRA
ncbi:TetR/AcrR family transcriptional regulator [Bordetella genomosp. 13]|uniref:TetR/AcrR family transcriptional regulator n=1 Tax=Bordetella genomosp. 13 TaxID=463040 RepID=UPI00119E34C8|nr:TetR/AcrR family transcriptional regulator [Bordetella genomosp. 13]